ncbi:hypothetical protein OOU_Y34scaffold01182g1 [Pyricularia oryzae Y34]|uniref:Uncharacterized protein n=1 Tax=Pyricularia oryzae (strain Y34) TaxID=1143189 RepID=A0AA97NLH1_PYRO3|nr:hypothetical protein OOU_Y34scaffold01182g1 [Pyricularia oryzae Y34]
MRPGSVLDFSKATGTAVPMASEVGIAGMGRLIPWRDCST